jgi:hypothetical protein
MQPSFLLHAAQQHRQHHNDHRDDHHPTLHRKPLCSDIGMATVTGTVVCTWHWENGVSHKGAPGGQALLAGRPTGSDGKAEMAHHAVPQKNAIKQDDNRSDRVWDRRQAAVKVGRGLQDQTRAITVEQPCGFTNRPRVPIKYTVRCGLPYCDNNKTRTRIDRCVVRPCSHDCALRSVALALACRATRGSHKKIRWLQFLL